MTLPPSSPPNPDLDKVTHSRAAEYVLDLDQILQKLLRTEPGERAQVSEKEVKAVCFLSRQIYANKPLLLEMKGSVTIVGDLHGQFYDLLRIFDEIGNPSKVTYLFLGNYVDRGHQGLDILILLLSYQLKYPGKIHLLRGNHENPELNRHYGFLKELKERFGNKSMKVWKSFLRMFQEMPLAAVIEESVFCVHGGLSPAMLHKSFKSLEFEFSQIPRPVNIETSGLVCDLLWSDPMDKPQEECIGWQPSIRGISHSFGIDVVEKFCEKFTINLIVRSHQIVNDGFEFYANRAMVTLFSAPRFCGTYENSGGLIMLEKMEDLEGDGDILRARFKILKPEVRFTTTKWYNKDNIFEEVEFKS